MRLRNIPRADSVLAGSDIVIKTETDYKGNWKEAIFHNSNPIHIEVGMGKGQFILALARLNPDINYIGIERYSSVLARRRKTGRRSAEFTVYLYGRCHLAGSI